MADTSTAGRSGFAPLAGIRVLDLSRMYPGGFCTLLLADLGAEVVKVEQPGTGDPVRMSADGGDSPSHVALNRGKRSITLNLKSPEAADVLRRLVETADVLVESQRPGSLDEMGLGYQDLSKINRRLVWCAVTGFGQRGPYAERPGHELTYLGHSGLLTSMCGEHFPWLPQFFMAGPLAGLMAVTGIVAGLHDRTRTGRGVQVDLGIVDANTWVLSDDVARVAMGLPTGWWFETAQRRVYRCADGKLISVAADERRTWMALCQGIGLDEHAAHIPRTPEEQAEMRPRLEALFASRPAAEWVDTLGPAWACVDPVNTPADLLTDEYLRARGAITTLADDPQGRRVFANPLHFVTEDGPAPRPAPPRPPALGADTDEVLGAVGFDRAAREQLRQTGAI